MLLGVHRGISVANIDMSDDNLEILVPNGGSSPLYCLKSDGNLLWAKALAYDVHDISIGDIDGDSCLELAVGTLGENKLWVLDDTMNTHGCDNAGVEEKEFKSSKIPQLKTIKDKIMFYLPRDGVVSLRLYDICGRLVEELISKSNFNSGNYTIKLSNIKSGIYFAYLVHNNEKLSAKIVLIK